MSIRLRWIAGPVAAAAALLASSFFLHPAVAWYGVPASGFAHSPNWAGYAAVGSPGAYSSVAGTWTVPAVQGCPAGGEFYSITWVGLDGAGVNQTVEQVGTEQSCYSGTAVYRTFFELYPAGPVFDGGFAVAPGDTITASVAAAGGRFVFTIADQTSGRSMTATRAASADRATAEAVFEAPNPAQAANVNRVAFTGVTVNGATIAASSALAVQMVGGNLNPLYTPSGLNGGSDFSIKRGS